MTKSCVHPGDASDDKSDVRDGAVIPPGFPISYRLLNRILP
jgi:hypothetical protein